MANRKIIIDKKTYREVVKQDTLRANQLAGKPISLAAILIQDQRFVLSKYIKLLQKEEYLSNTKVWYKIPSLLFVKIYRNRISMKLGINIPINVFDAGLVIWHYGNIAIHGNCVVGKNCQLHGSNCIGNKGADNIGSAPSLGDNIDIGFGASIIGDIYITNDVKIGAGAVVTKSCDFAGSTITGIPGKVKI